jgi:SAM-dependent methyltransferase
MGGFADDIPFYRQLLPGCASVLEIGCGTGRVARQLAGTGRRVVGIDISPAMLRLAARQPSGNCLFLCMDMVHLGFRQAFDLVVIAYNTLNLLPEKDRIRRCLAGCLAALNPGGKMVVQLFVPPSPPRATTFQFQMFDRPGGGRIIKEILKRPVADSPVLEIEERFRVRPMQPQMANSDYRSVYRIAAFSLERWLSLFGEAGLAPIRISGSYERKDHESTTSSCCLLELGRKM